jgi:hypothetical protein
MHQLQLAYQHHRGMLTMIRLASFWMDSCIVASVTLKLRDRTPRRPQVTGTGASFISDVGAHNGLAAITSGKCVLYNAQQQQQQL